jgi:hypothetical protein
MHELQCWLQVGISGHQDTDVVLAVHSLRHEVDREGYVDALFLRPCARGRPAERITKGAREYLAPRRPPSSDLSTVGSVGPAFL